MSWLLARCQEEAARKGAGDCDGGGDQEEEEHRERERELAGGDLGEG